MTGYAEPSRDRHPMLDGLRRILATAAARRGLHAVPEEQDAGGGKDGWRWHVRTEAGGHASASREIWIAEPDDTGNPMVCFISPDAGPENRFPHESRAVAELRAETVAEGLGDWLRTEEARITEKTGMDAGKGRHHEKDEKAIRRPRRVRQHFSAVRDSAGDQIPGDGAR